MTISLLQQVASHEKASGMTLVDAQVALQDVVLWRRPFVTAAAIVTLFLLDRFISGTKLSTVQLCCLTLQSSCAVGWCARRLHWTAPASRDALTFYVSQLLRRAEPCLVAGVIEFLNVVLWQTRNKTILALSASVVLGAVGNSLSGREMFFLIVSFSLSIPAIYMRHRHVINSYLATLMSLLQSNPAIQPLGK